MLGTWYDTILITARDAIAAVSGKITPTREAEIRREADVAIRKAGGDPADLARAQAEISATLEPYGGTVLPQYGGSALPSFGDVFGNLGAPSWILIGAGVLVLIVVLKR